MNIEEIKKNAPEGATHYHPVEPLYIKFISKRYIYVWWFGDWVKPKCKIKNSMMCHLIPLN